MSHHLTSDTSSSLRLNYLYPSGEVEDYGRKLYIFSSGQAQSAFSGKSGNYSPLKNGHQTLADHENQKSLSSEEQNVCEVHSRVERLESLLRLERENCREREDTISSLRRLVDEHERRMHHIDRTSSGARAVDLIRVSPTQKLLDQVNRLQQQKTELLVELSRYEGILGPNSRQSLHATVDAHDRHGDQPNRSSDFGLLRNPSASEVDVCSTDTEKELTKLKVTNTNLEEELQKLITENILLRQRALPDSSGASSETTNFYNVQEVPPTDTGREELSVSVSQVQLHTEENKQNLSESVSQVHLYTNVDKQNLSESVSQVQLYTEENKQNLSESVSQVPSDTQDFEKTSMSEEDGTWLGLCPNCPRMTSSIQHLECQLLAKDAELKDLKEKTELALEQARQEFHLESTAQSYVIESLKSELKVYRAGMATMLQQFRKLRGDYNTLRENVLANFTAIGNLVSDTKISVSCSVKDVVESHGQLMGRYLKEMARRRKYHNQLVQFKGNIRVVCRVRPWIEEDGPPAENTPVVTLDLDDDGKVIVKNKGRQRHFEFDKAFGMDSTQSEVFEEISSLVRSAMDGFHVCIFAYGQTGSGKTFTMEGGFQDEGIQRRALQLLFDEVKDPDWSYSLSASMLEIYNETIVDLLSPGCSQKLEVKLLSDGIWGVPGLTHVEVTSEQDVARVFETGRQVRATESTAMNSRSSRSHCLLVVTVTGHNMTANIKTHGRLNFVDLAGSERVSRTQADGDRLREARNINRSLACLGEVIHALRSRRQHVPYRNSKLTYLLQQSLGGDSKTLMIVQVAPNQQNVKETLCTLNFGMRVSSVELGHATRTINKLSRADSDCHSEDLDSSFSSSSSICSSPFSSPPSSPCPSPSPSPSNFLFSSPRESTLPRTPSVRTGKPLRRTVSTSSVDPAWRTQQLSLFASQKNRSKFSHPQAFTQVCHPQPFKTRSTQSQGAPSVQHGPNSSYGTHRLNSSVTQDPLSSSRHNGQTSVVQDDQNFSPSQDNSLAASAQPLRSTVSPALVYTSPSLKQSRPKPSPTQNCMNPPSSPSRLKRYSPQDRYRQVQRKSQVCATAGPSDKAQEQKDNGRTSTLVEPSLDSPDSTPTTSRSQSPNDTPTTTPTSSPKSARKSTTVKLAKTPAPAIKRVKKHKPSGHETRPSLLSNRDRWK